MRKGKFIFWLVFLAIVAFIPSRAMADLSDADKAKMEKYCVQPPYVKSDIKPNILIVMDNSVKNQEYAYQDATPKDPVSKLQRYRVALDGKAEYSGLFHSYYWYSYDGTQFVPDKNGVYEGNMLNWAATSMYDLIQVVLLGGKSNSRQTNVNRLIGLNDGDWDPKIYLYWDESVPSKFYACEIEVNEGNKGELIIRDNVSWVNLGYFCGLIRANPKRPHSSQRIISAASDYSDKALMYASASPVGMGLKVDSGAGGHHPAATAFFSALNTIISFFADVAEAKPVGIVSPNNDAIMPDANLNQLYSDYQISISSGYPLAEINAENWTVKTSLNNTTTINDLPTGMQWKYYPTGLKNDLAIIINGTPSDPAQVGSHTIFLMVNEDSTKIDSQDPAGDASGAINTTDFTSNKQFRLHLTINNKQLQIKYPPSGQAMTDAIYNNGYGYQSVATGGTGLYTWSASGLPAGLTMDVDGYVSGTTTAAGGTYNVTVTVNDGVNSVSANTTIRVRLTDLRIVDPIDGTTLPGAEVNKLYSYGLIATGGKGAYTWTLSSGSLPAGISIVNSAGAWRLIGTPSVPGTYNFTLKVSDGLDSRLAALKLTVKYDPVRITWPDIDYMNDAYFIPYGGGWSSTYFTVGDTICSTYYSNRFQPKAQGGSGNYTWFVSANFATIFPGFLFDNATGKMYGTITSPPYVDPFSGIIYPCSTSSGTITVSVIDNVTGQTASVPLYMYRWTPGTALTPIYIVDGMVLPIGYAGKPYSGFSIGSYYGDGQITWSVSPSTPLPSGLFINSTSGVIEGNVSPTAAPGNYAITIKAVSGSTSQSKNLVLPIVAPGGPIITWPASGYKIEAYVNEQVKITPTVVNGVTPYTYSIANLPAGLTMSALDGTISGSVAIANLYNTVTWSVKDARGLTSTISLQFYIRTRDALTIVYPTSGEVFETTETIGTTIGTFAATGGYGPYTWSATGLPSGLTLDPASGVIEGIPATGTSTGSPFSVTVTVKDSRGATYSRSIQIKVASKLTLIMQSATYNIQVCASSPTYGDPYLNNCKTGTQPADGFKTGLLQEFFDQARFGLMDFNNAGEPNLNICPPANTPSSFYTAVENATPVLVDTRLVDATYKAIQAYLGNLPTDNCDPFLDKPQPEECVKNYVLMLTSGDGANNPTEYTASDPMVFGDDAGVPSRTMSPPWTKPEFPAAACTAAVYNMSKNSCYGWEVEDLRTDVEPAKQKVSTYVVNAMGKDTLHNDILKQTANVSEGNYYYADKPSELKDKIEEAFKDILKRAASGTAASVLASGKGQGAALIQAVYYPQRKFPNPVNLAPDTINWIGRLSAFWYYVDPYMESAVSSIHEETKKDNTLVLADDYIVNLYFDTTTQVVRAKRYLDADGDGAPDSDVSIPGPDGKDLEFEYLGSLWEAGLELWKRDLAVDPRRILVNLTNTPGAALMSFDTSLSSNATLMSNLNVATSAEAQNIIMYVNGYDLPGFRSRTVYVDINGDGDADDAGESPARVWKLGDVLNSTPRIASHLPINDYAPNSSCWSYEDVSYRTFTESSVYNTRGMVYTGSNDGVLHAVKLGYFDQVNITGAEKAKLTLGSTLDPLGKEIWAFLPKNALPYLKYQMAQNYCHIYTVDQSPYLADVAIQRPAGCDASTPDEICTREADAWRTVLIGGMRFGGGCKSSTVTCSGSNTVDTNLDGEVDANDCINTPLPGVGYSSYFALDVTEENNPKFLWEFTHPNLGASSTSVAIARVAAHESDGTTFNMGIGHWYAIFGSGPTGPMSPEEESYQYMANSDQNLSIFVVEIKSGKLMNVFDSGIKYAYAGSMLDTTNDIQLSCHFPGGPDYEDEVVYVPYINRCSVEGVSPVKCTLNEWNDGGVLRLRINSEPDPKKWELSSLIKHVGPMTSAPAAMIRGGNTIEQWVFGGSGRYNYVVNAGFINTGSAIKPDGTGRYEIDDPLVDDPNVNKIIFGIKDPCLNATGFIPGCTAEVDTTKILDATFFDAGVNTENATGWLITLDSTNFNAEPKLFAEREITDPVLDPVSGIVYFTTTMPYADKCAFGGKSFVWAVLADSGGAPGAAAQGTALIQVSTGAIEKLDLSSALTERGGRRTAPLEGVPPLAKGLGISMPPAAIKKTLHVIESDK